MAELRGKSTVSIAPASTILRKSLALFKDDGYIEDFEFVENAKGGEVKVRLTGKINNCGTVRPRFAVKSADWEKWEERYLPARGVGLIVVSTSSGIMSHKAAKEKHLGGKLVCFAY